MTALFLLLLILFLTGSVAAQDEKAPRVIAERYMKMGLATVHRAKPIRLSDYASEKKVLVLAMWATWCIPCRFSMPELNKIERDFAARGVTVIGLSNTSNEPGLSAMVRDYVRIRKLKFTCVWIPEEMYQDLNRRKILPVTLVVSSDGIISKEFLGWNNKETPARLRAAIEEMLKTQTKQ